MRFFQLFALVLWVSQAHAAEVIYGEDFAFSVTVPKGWHCECDPARVAAINANAAFYHDGQSLDNADPLISIRVKKRGKSPQKDLDADFKMTQSTHLSMKSEPFKVKMPETASSVLSISDGLTEYVTYYYPRKSKTDSMSITMHFDLRQANSDELKAYEAIIRSIKWLPAKVKPSPKPEVIVE